MDAFLKMSFAVKRGQTILRHRISDNTLFGIYLTVKERNDKTTPQ